MPKKLPSTHELFQALKDEGFELPEECADVRMLMPVDGIFQLERVVNLYGDRLAQVGRALAKLGEQK